MAHDDGGLAAGSFSMCSYQRKTLPEDGKMINFQVLECEERGCTTGFTADH